MCKISAYQVWGDMMSDKSSENYPTKYLCSECASSYEIISAEGTSEDVCEDCGCEYSDEEE